jgi:hypothetical protein
VAYIINPVFAVDFMKPHEDETTEEFKKKSKKSSRKTAMIGWEAAQANLTH